MPLPDVVSGLLLSGRPAVQIRSGVPLAGIRWASIWWDVIGGQCFFSVNTRQKRCNPNRLRRFFFRNVMECVHRAERKKSPQAIQSLRRFGDPAEIRTPDTLLKRQVLCRLSYWVRYEILCRAPGRTAGSLGCGRRRGRDGWTRTSE